MSADFVNDPTNLVLGYSQVRLFEDIARRGFDKSDHGVVGSGRDFSVTDGAR